MITDSIQQASHITEKNERVSIEVSAPGWIIAAAVLLVRFIAKVIFTMLYRMVVDAAIVHRKCSKREVPGWTVMMVG